MSSSWGEAQVKARHQGKAEGPRKGLWDSKVLVMLEGESFQETPISAWRPEPADVSQVMTHLLDELHLLLQEVALQEVMELRVCTVSTRACSSRRT